MTIAISTLRNAALYYSEYTYLTLNEAKARHLKTAFLCHSHADQTLVNGLQVCLKKEGWEVYIDWQDGGMPDSPNRETADRIKQRIREFDLFLFLATPNSTSSRWCPWEIGYADGKKPIDSILVIPTNDNSGKHYGNEYLQLYRKIDFCRTGKLAAFKPRESSGILLEGI
jgi:TIR domain